MSSSNDSFFDPSIRSYFKRYLKVNLKSYFKSYLKLFEGKFESSCL
jgi:hypothetical protein